MIKTLFTEKHEMAGYEWIYFPTRTSNDIQEKYLNFQKTFSLQNVQTLPTVDCVGFGFKWKPSIRNCRYICTTHNEKKHVFGKIHF